MDEEIMIQDENGKKYSVLRVLDADTKKIIDDLSALVIKKDKIIDLMANEIYIEHNPHFNTVEDVKKYFEERCK